MKHNESIKALSATYKWADQLKVAALHVEECKGDSQALFRLLWNLGQEMHGALEDYRCPD